MRYRTYLRMKGIYLTDTKGSAWYPFQTFEGIDFLNVYTVIRDEHGFSELDMRNVRIEEISESEAGVVIDRSFV